MAAAALASARAQEPPQENHCLACHGTRELWEADTLHLFVTAEEVAADVHWQRGLRCHDCHGGNPGTLELREAHAVEDGFRKIGSPVDIPDFCGRCHSDAAYMQRFGPNARTDQVARFWSSAHGQHLKKTGGTDAATCTSCHPQHKTRVVTDPQSTVHPLRLVETCGNCHREQLVELRKSVHNKAGQKKEDGGGTLLDCTKCHGSDVHGMVSVQANESPVFLDHQVQVCGGCHEGYLRTYQQSVHGRGLEESGLLVTAACANCHGAHGIFYAADRRSTLHSSKVADTCGTCHRFIKGRLDSSIHGRREASGGTTPPEASGGRPRRKPSCTDCHQGHDQPQPSSLAFRLQLPNRCGNCHPDPSHRYRMSLHGELTQLGYEPAAKCSDCHGAHDITAIDDPQSRLAGRNRVRTCAQCHPHATARFVAFDPHANHKDPQRYPALHDAYVWTEFILYSVLGFFAVHAVLWFVRSFVHTLQYGRHKRLATQQVAVVRFQAVHRGSYLLLIVSFLGLVLTGLPLKYSGDAWAQRLADTLGGFDSTSVWHHFFALVLLSVSVAHVIRVGKKLVRLRGQKVDWKRILVGPDSPVPNLRDVQDLLEMFRWFLGLGRKPKFERWTYWEKFDYWAVCLGVAVIGTSGLMLWLPNVFTWFLPGQALNWAKMIHAEVALAAGGFLFVIHAFNTHLRPEKFPLDLSLFTGLVSEEHLRMARPEYLERMHREGKLEQIRTLVPGKRRLRATVWVGLVVLSVGLTLLGGILLVSLGK